MKMRVFVGLIITLSLFAQAQSQTLDKAKLDQFFDRLAEKNKAMGSLLITKEGKPVYARSIGYSQVNGTAKKPLDANTKFHIGSITKIFTAAMILQLAEEKKLKLTDTLARFFPQIPNAGKITILQILSHHSGIPDTRPKQNADGNVKTLPMSKADHLALIVQAAPDFEPGTKSAYSNAGYFVLGLIIEKITGKSYETALQERIAKKIGLKNTYAATEGTDINKNEALTYFILPGEDWKPVPETHPSILFGSGAIISTPQDLAAFIYALFNGKIISKQSLEQMKTLHDNEGLGLVTFEMDGKTFYGHTGGIDNNGAWLMYEPQEKLAVAYTTNAKVYPVKDIIAGVVDIYYNKPFEVPTFESLAVSIELLDKYVGVYVFEGAPVKFTITRQGNTLYAQPPGAQSPVALEATAADKFKIDNGTPTGIVIEFDAAKNQMTVKRNGQERTFTKEK